MLTDFKHSAYRVGDAHKSLLSMSYSAQHRAPYKGRADSKDTQHEQRHRLRNGLSTMGMLGKLLSLLVWVEWLWEPLD